MTKHCSKILAQLINSSCYCLVTHLAGSLYHTRLLVEERITQRRWLIKCIRSRVLLSLPPSQHMLPFMIEGYTQLPET